MNTPRKPLQCLLVEDSADDAELLLRALRTGGFDVTWERVETAGAMRAALDRQPWDLIIADHSMPQFSGLAALEVLKTSGLDLPFILISGTMGEEQAVAAMRAGVHDYFIKGRLALLIPAVERELQNAAARREQRKAAATLLESKQQLQTYIDNAGDAIYVVERATGRIQNCNARACLELGYSRAELLQLTTMDIEAQLSSGAVVALHQQQKAGEPRTITGTHRRKDGTLFPVEIRLSSLAPAQPELILSIVRNITERQRAEQALRKSEVEFRTTFEMASIGMAQANPHTGRFQRVNQKMCAITGYTAEELLKMSVRDVTYPDDRQADGQLFQRVIKGAQPDYQIEKRYVRKDGSLVWVSINMTVIRNADGRPVHTMATIEDITARKQAEEAIQRERVLSDTIIDSIPGTFYLLDEHGRYARWNTYQREEILGKPDDQMSGMNALDTIHPEDRALIQARIANVLQDGKEETVEGRVLLRGGPAFIWMLMTGRRMMIADRPFLVGTGIDITARKQAVEALQRYAMAVEQSSDGIAITDMEGKLVLVNNAWAQMHGCEISGQVGQPLALNHTPEQMARDVIPFNAALLQHGSHIAEVGHRRKDGTTFPTRMSGTLMKDEHGKLVGMVGIARDITEQMRTEQEHLRLSTAIEQAAETVVITDTTGTILYANPAFEKVTGYTRAEAYGQNPRVLKSGKQDAEFYRNMWALLTAGEVWAGHLINKRKDGALYEEDATISPVLDAKGQIINYVAVKRDVTREVALETQNRQAAKMEAIGRLAGGVAHDFNNQLQVILGNVELILAGLPTEHPIQADLHEIQASARRSADLTRQLLAFSRKQTIEPVVLELNAAIGQSLKMLNRLIGENISLNFLAQSVAENVFMDPGQLDQLLANLVVNARDAIPGSGTISINVTNRMLQESDCQGRIDFIPPGDYVVLTVRDDGAGMTPEIQSHIFEPFFTTKALGKGTGLGLAMVFGIVKQNNGAITVHSAPQQGTTFTIYLPRVRAAVPAAAGKPEERIPTGTETILLVEDEKSVLELIKRTLAKQGYKVLAAATPQLALQTYAQYPDTIHLLLTDVIMPTMSGKELTERIQALRPDIRILFMSGYSADIIAQQGHLPEGLNLLQKPFSSAALAQRIRAALDTPPAP
jgi:PAS domain S-box-containing protein